MNRGFSLVELSIVLVILGLLVGGVLSGQSLIRASELRAVSTEFSKYVTASQSFRDKYFAIPGDIPNATKFWGKDAAACAAVTDPAGTPGTCNGDGDGVLTGCAAGATCERFQFWKHLALASLIEGTYSGLAGAGGANDSTIGTNVPRSKMSNGGWNASNYNNSGGGGAIDYALDFGNDFFVGSPQAGASMRNPLLKPEEAWNIDTKMDDGKPGTGKVIAREITAFNTATSCTTSTANTDFTGAYNLGYSTIACSLLFQKTF